MLISVTFVPYLFYPILSAVIAVILGVLAKTLLPQEKRGSRLVSTAVGILYAGAAVAVIVCLSVYYSKEIAGKEGGSGVNSAMLWLFAAVMACFLGGVAYIFGKKTNKDAQTLSITLGAISVAVGFALSFATVFRLPQGGEVTLLGVLPLMLYAWMFGVRKGALVGVVFGLLAAIQDPFIVHPAQFLLDYVIAYAAVGIVGVFASSSDKPKLRGVRFVIGGVCYALVRYFSHVLSGVFAFASFVGKGYSLAGWSFAYNSFCLVDAAISIIVGMCLVWNGHFNKLLQRVRTKATRNDKEVFSDKKSRSKKAE